MIDRNQKGWGIRVSLKMVACVVVCAAGPLWGNVRMPAVFSDNMVLQKGVPLPVCGWAAPGEKVAVEFAGQRRETSADAAGKWSVRLDPLTASAVPSEMRISGQNTTTIRNVLVGDVWMASGQSNMEMAVRGVSNAAQEMAEADCPGIRFFMIERDLSSAPKDDCAGKWVVCAPTTVAPFSAAAYFFARELNRKYKMPTGVINSSVGASSCQAWTPASVLTADKTLPQLPDIAPENYVSWKVYLAYRNGEYDRSSYADTGIRPECRDWAKPDFDDAGWNDFKAPGNIEAQGMAIDGAVWFRKTVDVPAELAGQNMTLALGPISDNDIAFVNGEKVGATVNNWREWVFRNYAVPGKLIKAGRNVIAVRIFNRIGSGGFYPGYPAPLRLEKTEGNAVILSGVWKCKVERGEKPAKLPGPLPSVYSVPSAFYNAMIAPFTTFSIRGCIWYQGEGNAGAAKQHDTLFPAMIESWRKAWDNPKMPFYFVQLASFRPREAQPTEGGWPRLRESQLKTLALHDTGMAVTIDIGEALQIHPHNKQDVGRRLARWAMRDCYGEEGIEVCGPLYASDAVEGGQVLIRFTHASGGLHAKGGALKGFAIAGADKKFVWAQARIDGDRVAVWSDGVKEPRFVRYAWADNPECTLVNGENLPASPFRTDGD